ncbi:MAG TPA: hypothetical protein VFB44_10940 [Thermoleophilaceae bacterium]|nr:hypothetical protein [Thermoleophilaceae bacterium]
MARIAVACVSLLVASGCGTGSSERAVSETVGRFQRALAADDGRAGCAELTAAARRTLELDEMKPCPAALLDLDLLGGGAAAEVQIAITSARARVPGRGSLFLDQTPTGWRIGAAGCVPGRFDGPYDCELD